MKVVCINAEPVPGLKWNLGTRPTVGAVYTVVSKAISPRDGVTPVFYLAELVNPVGYMRTRFRPLTDTSISDVLAKAAPRDSRKWDNRRKVREKV